MQKTLLTLKKAQLVNLVWFHLRRPDCHGCPFPDGLKIPSRTTVRRMVKAELRELVIKLRIPCTPDTVEFTRKWEEDVMTCGLPSFCCNESMLELYMREAKKLC